MRMVKRIISVLFLLLAVTILAFAITELLPGDPAVAILGDQATPEMVRELRTKLGLDKPLTERYIKWLGGALSGDFGYSYRTNESVIILIQQRMPVTVELILLTQFLALGVAVPLAILSAYRTGGIGDRLVGQLCMILLSTPPFLIGILLIYGFSVAAGLFPASGFVPLEESITGNLKTMLLPAITLALVEIPLYLRILRADLIQTLQQDFIMVARAKGLAPVSILVKHALKPSSFSLITVIGVNVGRLIGGAVIIEVLFALPGIGQLLVNAVYQHDHYAIQGIVLMVAVVFVIVNLSVDALYSLLDPRVRRASR